MSNYYILLFCIAITLFGVGFICGLLDKKSKASLNDTFYSNTGSFSLITDYDYNKADDNAPIIIKSTIVEDEF